MESAKPQSEEEFIDLTECFDTLFSESASESLVYAECEICCEKKLLYRVNQEQCAHSYCQLCLKEYIVVQSQKLTGEDALVCPEVSCGKGFSNKTLNHLFSALLEEASQQPYLLHCGMCKRFVIIAKKTQQVLQCTFCRASYDKQSRALTERSQKEIEHIKEMRKNGLIECPRCLVWVHKTEGCDHITCTCGYHFCYVCGSHRPGYSGHTCRPHDYGIFGGHLSKVE